MKVFHSGFHHSRVCNLEGHLQTNRGHDEVRRVSTDSLQKKGGGEPTVTINGLCHHHPSIRSGCSAAYWPHLTACCLYDLQFRELSLKSDLASPPFCQSVLTTFPSIYWLDSRQWTVTPPVLCLHYISCLPAHNLPLLSTTAFSFFCSSVFLPRYGPAFWGIQQYRQWTS
jgi:hypothetical protein